MKDLRILDKYRDTINGKQSEWVDLFEMPYCPACGAKMDE